MGRMVEKIIKEITSDIRFQKKPQKAFLKSYAIVEIIQEPGRNANFYPVF